MPWFKVDDRAHGHPKVMAAGTAAYGLWTRCGSYSAEHLTDGIVPKSVARMYGTATMSRRLVDSGLWHSHGHDCPRCEQPPKGDYVMHDYLDHNPSRQEVEAEREAARTRMKRRRSGGSSADVRPNTNRTSEEGSGEVRGPRTRPRTRGSYGTPPPTPADDTTPAPSPPDTGGGDLLTLIRDQTGATDDQAAAVLDHIRDRHNPRSLSAYVRSMATRGTLTDVLTEMTPAAPRISPRDEWMYRQ